MWLLHTSKIKLHFFIDHQAAQAAGGYAILSHTWGKDEVSFLEMRIIDDASSSNQRDGMDKINGCCAQAARDGFDYVWIDTCCIDKTNNTELSEAINSMFNWYRCAIECYAYLNYVTITPKETPASIGRGVSESK
jgi:hypothetical protein